MLTLSPVELLTLALYLVTVSLLLVAIAAEHARAKRLSAAVSILVGALTTLCLWSSYTGAAEGWLELATRTVERAPAASAPPARLR